MTSRCTLASAQRGPDMLAPYPRRALGLLHRARADSLVRNSVLIMVTTVVNSLLGYVFWVVAARTYAAAEVGLVTALISAMGLTSMLSSLGTGQTLLQLLPRQRDPAQWWLVFMAALSVGIAGGLLGGILVVVGLPVISHQFAVVRDNLWLAGSFITAVAMWTVAQQLDLTFVAERRAGLMLVRNAFFAVIRFVPLAISALAGTATALVLFDSYALGCLLACMLGFALLFMLRGRRLPVRGLLGQARSMATRLIGHHFIQVGAQLPMCLLPVLVAIRLSTTANAYFYVTWMVGGIFFLISPSVAQSLVAEGGHDPAAFAQRLRSASRMLVVLLAVPMVVVFFGGHLILSTFGHNYAAHATSLLRILVIAAIPDAFTNIYVSAMRVCDRLGRAAALNISMGCGAIGLSWVLLPGMGIAGAGWAWLIAQSVGAVVALIDLRRHHRQDASSLAQSADKPARDTAAEVNFAGVQAEA